MTREEINYSGKKDLFLQAFCIGIEVAAIIILFLIFLKRFLPFFFTKTGFPGLGL